MPQKIFQKLYTITLFLALSFVAVSLAGCNATYKMVKHNKLEVETQMSDTIFMEPSAKTRRSVLLQVRNTTDKPNLDVEAKLREALYAKGYQITMDPGVADIMLQVNVLQVAKTFQEEPLQALSGGYGGAISGAVTGAIAGRAFSGSKKSQHTSFLNSSGHFSSHSSSSYGKTMAGMALVGGIIGTIVEAAVDVVQYSMVADIQISEKTNVNVAETGNVKLNQGRDNQLESNWSQKSHWKKYQTRAVSVAKKVNLKFEQAAPELTQSLAASISGVL